MDFTPSDDRSVRALRVVEVSGETEAAFYRITHVFNSTIFLMRVKSAEQAVNAPRPQPWPRARLLHLIESKQARFGTLSLPPELANCPDPGTDEDAEVSASMEVIQPLLDAFEREENLGRTFTSRIALRAKTLALPRSLVSRLLLRFWYFGGVRYGVLPLRRGPKPLSALEDSLQGRPQEDRPRRRGRRPLTTGSEKPSNWAPIEADIDDMERAAERCIRDGKRSIEEITKAYIRTEFRRRYPEQYASYMRGETTDPVTQRMVAYRLRTRDSLSAALRAAVPALDRARSQRALHALGPGDVYELDATGGQIVIVDRKDPRKILKRLTIYILVDRWSRYVVSVYVSLRAPSAEGVRKTLRIAFTSRLPRFKLLGVNVDDQTWPPAVIPAQIAVDRGPDMIAEATVALAVRDLKTNYVVLPPFTPDGKAIIERLNRTLKAKMKAKGLKGLYEKFTTLPKLKGSMRAAQLVACLSLREVYRELLDIVDDYNHSIHHGLKERVVELSQNGVAATPHAAYVWGLENISGGDRSVLDRLTYDRLTLRTVQVKMKNGVLVWEKLRFFPNNHAALRISQSGRPRSAARTTDGTISAKVDDTSPTKLWMVTSDAQWPEWVLDSAGMAIVAQRSIEEREELGAAHAVDAAAARRNALRRVLSKDDERLSSPKARAAPKTAVSDVELRACSAAASSELDDELMVSSGRNAPRAKASSTGISPPPRKATLAAAAQDEMDALVRRLGRTRK